MTGSLGSYALTHLFVAGYAQGKGVGKRLAYLLAKDISSFDSKAPPPKTAAFWSMVFANESPEAMELKEAIEQLGKPSVLRISELKEAASIHSLRELLDDLSDRKQSKSWGKRLAKVGYVPVQNPDTKDGLFKVDGKYCVVYANKDLSLSDQIKAARDIKKT